MPRRSEELNVANEVAPLTWPPRAPNTVRSGNRLVLQLLFALRRRENARAQKHQKFNLPVVSAVEAKSFRRDRENLTTPLRWPLYAFPGNLAENLVKAKARWRAPRPWRCETET